MSKAENLAEADPPKGWMIKNGHTLCGVAVFAFCARWQAVAQQKNRPLCRMISCPLGSEGSNVAAMMA